MSALVGSFAAIGALIGGLAGLGSAYSDSEKRSIAGHVIAGMLIGAVIVGSGAATVETSVEPLKETFSPAATSSDAEQCIKAAPSNSKAVFTRNPDGTTVCSYSMR